MPIAKQLRLMEELELEKRVVITLQGKIYTADARQRPSCHPNQQKAKEEFKKNIELTLTANWKEFCTRHKDVWSCSQRVITRCLNTNWIQSSLLRDPQMNLILSAEALVEHLTAIVPRKLKLEEPKFFVLWIPLENGNIQGWPFSLTWSWKKRKKSVKNCV